MNCKEPATSFEECEFGEIRDLLPRGEDWGATTDVGVMCDVSNASKNGIKCTGVKHAPCVYTTPYTRYIFYIFCF